MTNNRPTIADVARRAGVSIATVSRVLNNNGVVLEATIQRVQTAIKELNYVPHAAARTLASQKTQTLGLLLPEIGGVFFQPLLQGIEAGASESGYDLLIHTTQNRPGTLPRRTLAEHNTDGLLVFTGSLDLKELTRLAAIGFPLVLMHQTAPAGLVIPIITIENQSGAQEIVEHLVKVHQRRRIAFLQGPDDQEDSSWREKGYWEALVANGIALDPALIQKGNFDRDTAHDSVAKMLASGLDVDGIFTGDDESAIGALKALREAGCRVPQDISVVGFDDSMFASTLVPPLTTVHAPTDQVGRRSVLQLVRMIKGEEVEPVLRLGTNLVIRQSCGCN